MNRRSIGLLAGILACFASGGAPAQQGTARIWDVPFGTHVRNLPTEAFVEPACGTNGGPPSMRLDGFTEFARCPIEAATGLREIWFIYDDEREYVAKAMRDPASALRFRATVVLNQPVVLSLLVDNDGRVQGYRIVTDSRTEPDLRIDAYTTSLAFKNRFGEAGWTCIDLSPAEGERPVNRQFIKQECERVEGGLRAYVATQLFHKPGQYQVDPNNGRIMVNEFQSWAYLEARRLTPAVLPETPPAPPRNLAFLSPREAFLVGREKNCPGCDLAGVSLKRRDLAGANLAGATLEGTSLHAANLRGANLEGAILNEANLNRANLIGANLRGAQMSGVMMYEADATRADLRGADLTEGLLAKARLILAKLDDAVLNYANLEETRLTDASLRGANVSGANLGLATLFRADLRDAVMRGSNLAEAELRGANLEGAALRYSDLYRADLADADLRRADLRDTRLLSATLQGARQDDALFAGALMPDNTVHP